MKQFLGILLMTLANLILLAHSIIPHNNCKEDHQHDEVVCHHEHNHDYSHDLSLEEQDFDLSHLFCHIAHGESDFVYQNEISHDIGINNIVILSLYRTLFNHSVEKEITCKQLFVAEKIPIYNSPHLIRSGEKAPPIA